MDCHKCPTAVEINQGKYLKTPFKNTPCHKCRLAKGSNHHGQTHVAVFSSPEPGQADLIEEVAPSIFFDEDVDIATQATAADSIMDSLIYLAKELLRLPPKTREIVLDRLAYPEQPLSVTAKRVGICLSWAHTCLQRAREDWPALAYAIDMKTRNNASQKPE